MYVHTPEHALSLEGEHAISAPSRSVVADALYLSHSYQHDGQPQLAPGPVGVVYGNPELAAQYWTYQRIDGMCGPDSIAMLLSQVSGQHVTEYEVATWALMHGDMTDDGHTPGPTELGYGMTVSQVASVLDAAGVPCSVQGDVSVEQLELLLAGGHHVILSVDAQRIWFNGPDPDVNNHFVELTGIDPSTGYAYLNDPGSPYGQMEAVPISQLMSALEPGGYEAIVTDLGSAA